MDWQKGLLIRPGEVNPQTWYIVKMKLDWYRGLNEEKRAPKTEYWKSPEFVESMWRRIVGE